MSETTQRRPWTRTRRGRPPGRFRGRGRRQSVRSLEQHDHEVPNGFGIRFPELVDTAECSTRYHKMCSNVWQRLHTSPPFQDRFSCIRSSHERLKHNRLSGSDVMVDDVVVDQPFSPSKFSQRGYHPSSSNYQRGRRIFKRKHNCYGRDQENYRRNEDISQDYKHGDWRLRTHDEASSHTMHCRLSSSMEDFVEPMIDAPKLQSIRPTNKRKGFCYSKGVPSLGNVGSSRKLLSKPLEDHEEVELKKKLNVDDDEVEMKKKLSVVPNGSLNHASTLPSHNACSSRKQSSKSEEGKEIVDLQRNTDALPNGFSNNASPRMGDLNANCHLKEGGSSCYYKLMKDHKLICQVQCTNPPIQLSSCWNLEIVKQGSKKNLADLPWFSLFPAFENSHQYREWPKFMGFLYNHNKVAVVEFERLKIYILPPEGKKSSETTTRALNFEHAVVAYEVQEAHDTTLDLRHATSVANGAGIKSTNSVSLKRSVHENETQGFTPPPLAPSDASIKDQKVMPVREAVHSTHLVDAAGLESDAHVKGSNSAEKGTCSSISKYSEAVNSLRHFAEMEGNSTERNFVRTDPSYLKTLGQAHSGWIFGAIAELVDNSRDANASRLDISIETVYCKKAGCEIPMLSIIDDGDGMNHEEILRMISFGHKQPDEDNTDRIGRFGVGFKTGTMRLGRDAFIFTQTTKARSVAFLSQSLNEGKDNVEIPIVSYCRQAQCMEFDTSVQSEALAKDNLKAIKDFSPFNKYLIGEKAALFKSNTGTQIYIWNLDKWGSDYSLEWQAGLCGGSSFHHGDIFVHSRRVRSRPGQTSKTVPLDYSLRCYLEVIFLEPRMKIYLQGSPVRSPPLAKSLNNTAVIDGKVMGKPVQLTLGCCQLEWEQANCGIFLYWHGRLIEAYKRVGGMIHSADMGRGVIGVIDVTELMDDGNGGVWVHSNKQGFQDCEPYAFLETWLGNKADEYWDTYFDAIQLKKGKAKYKPDHEWVQCEKCRKWRMLDAGFDSRILIGNWFCYMQPFNGRCEMLEQKPDRGVITVGTKRLGACSGAVDCKDGIQVDNNDSMAEGKNNDDTKHTLENNVTRPVLKRVRRGQTQCSAKT